jgi:ADP-ribose pyrophosphatase YjhB (NUDIX family)
VAHKRYNLVFLFNRQLTKVLLMKKYKGPYPVTYNGVGGKTEAGESAKHGAIRETKEETGVDIKRNIKWLLSCQFPGHVYLSVYCAIVDEDAPKQMEAEPIAWYKIRDVFRDHVTPLAGEGNVKYFIEASINLLRSEHHDKS